MSFIGDLQRELFLFTNGERVVHVGTGFGDAEGRYTPEQGAPGLCGAMFVTSWMPFNQSGIDFYLEHRRQKGRTWCSECLDGLVRRVRLAIIVDELPDTAFRPFLDSMPETGA